MRKLFEGNYMKRVILFLSYFPVLLASASAQTNVRAWYADGQVWVVWQAEQPFPLSYAIYKSDQLFTNTCEATLIGRPLAYEYAPAAFVTQTADPNFRYKVPNPDGSIYTLQANEALFVETTLDSGPAYYAVVEWGQTQATAGVNRTQDLVSFNYDPIHEPVTCHLQMTETLISGHKTFWFAMWLLGRDEHWSSRPDFPVMANGHKNGMPAMFIVSTALGIDTTGGTLIPATNWFHGGGGTANAHTANKTKHFNIAPEQGISVSHNDDFPRLVTDGQNTIIIPSRSKWFGWAKMHDPFDPNFSLTQSDTIVNYTQRRILWINDWLVKHFNVDPTRIALQGYSMGSAGASALGKAFRTTSQR